MKRSVVKVSGKEKLKLDNLQVYRNAFPKNICQALHEYILSQPERKVVHPITAPGYSVPTQITQALPNVPFLGEGNVIITKRYEPTGASDAFDFSS